MGIKKQGEQKQRGSSPDQATTIARQQDEYKVLSPHVGNKNLSEDA
jgi:hypothetical protein